MHLVHNKRTSEELLIDFIFVHKLYLRLPLILTTSGT